MAEATHATLTPSSSQVSGSSEHKKKDHDFQTTADLASIGRGASSSNPLFGIAKQIVKMVASKSAAKDSATASADEPDKLIWLARHLDDTTNKAWRDWLPEQIAEHCKLEDDQVVHLDLIMALQTALTNIDVFEEWQLFYACSCAFNGRRVNFEWLDKPTYEECAWACTVLRTLRPNVSFGPGVIRFILAVMLEDGLVFFPWTGGDGIALDDGETGGYIRGLTDCQDLAADMRKVWKAGVIEKATSADIDVDAVDQKDDHHVQITKLMRGAAYIRSHYKAKS